MTVGITFLIDCNAVAKGSTLEKPTGLLHEGTIFGHQTHVLMMYSPKLEDDQPELGPFGPCEVVDVKLPDSVRLSVVHAGGQHRYHCAIVRVWAGEFGDDPPGEPAKPGLDPSGGNPIVTPEIMNDPSKRPIDVPRFNSTPTRSGFLDYIGGGNPGWKLDTKDNGGLFPGVNVCQDAKVVADNLRVPYVEFDVSNPGYFQYRIELEVAKDGERWGYAYFDPWLHIER